MGQETGFQLLPPAQTMSLRRSSPSLQASIMNSRGRKRATKACGRCKLKKSKCHGETPCDRCRRDNAICVFRSPEKVHQKGYTVEYIGLLEKQQMQLVLGLQEMYRRTLSGQGWLGAPLTHDILERLGVLEHDTHSNPEFSGSDKEGLQVKSIDDGERFLQAQDSSTNSDSDQTQAQAQDSMLTTKTEPPALSPDLTSSTYSPFISSIPESSCFQGFQAEKPIDPFSAIMPDMVPQALHPAAFEQAPWTDPTTTYDQSMELQGYFSPTSFDTYRWVHV